MDNEFTSVAAWLQATGPYGLVAVLGWAFWRVNEKKDRELKALHEKIVELAEAQTARGSKVFAPGRRRERGARSGSARERSALTHERTTDGRISCQLSGRGPGATLGARPRRVPAPDVRHHPVAALAPRAVRGRVRPLRPKLRALVSPHASDHVKLRADCVSI